MSLAPAWSSLPLYVPPESDTVGSAGASTAVPTPDVPEGILIGVCGPIGVGKSTLAELLARRLGAAFVAERFDADANPFLDRFYAERQAGAVPDGTVARADRPSWSLATELSFLTQRVDMVRDISTLLARGTSVVTDWTAAQNLVFSALTLPEDEFRLYESLYLRLMEGVRTPDLVVVLDAPVEVLQGRIQGRGRAKEAGIAAEYLAAVRRGYQQWRALPPAPMLWLDASDLRIHDPLVRAETIAMITTRLHAVRADARRVEGGQGRLVLGDQSAVEGGDTALPLDLLRDLADGETRRARVARG